jgi:hypothetical protein
MNYLGRYVVASLSSLPREEAVLRGFARKFCECPLAYGNAASGSTPGWTTVLANCIRLLGDRFLRPFTHLRAE